MKKRIKAEPFDRILLESIDEALCSLGESVKISIYFHLWDKFEIRKKEIPSRLCEVSNAMESIFGLGARQLEILFMKSLHSKIALECEWPNDCKWIIPNVTFVEYVSLMRQKFEKTIVSKLKIGVLVDAFEKQEQYR